MATYKKVNDALNNHYVSVIQLDGKLYRFEIDQSSGSRIYFHGRHRIFETKLANVKIVEEFNPSQFADDVVILYPPTPENRKAIYSATISLNDRY